MISLVILPSGLSGSSEAATLVFTVRKVALEDRRRGGRRCCRVGTRLLVAFPPAVDVTSGCPHRHRRRFSSRPEAELRTALFDPPSSCSWVPNLLPGGGARPSGCRMSGIMAVRVRKKRTFITGATAAQPQTPWQPA